jgi:hypothetical protein
MPSHTRRWQSIYGMMWFCKMDQKPRIKRKIKASRWQTMKFWRHLKQCHLSLFARSLKGPSPHLQLYFAAWRNRFTSSWSDCVGFPIDSRIFNNKLGSSYHYAKGVPEAAWVHETSFVGVRSDARKGLVLFFIFLSFSWSRINLAQSRRWCSIKGEKKCVISEDDADSRLEPTRISFDWCPIKG